MKEEEKKKNQHEHCPKGKRERGGFSPGGGISKSWENALGKRRGTWLLSSRKKGRQRKAPNCGTVRGSCWGDRVRSYVFQGLRRGKESPGGIFSNKRVPRGKRGPPCGDEKGKRLIQPRGRHRGGEGKKIGELAATGVATKRCRAPGSTKTGIILEGGYPGGGKKSVLGQPGG